MTQFIASPILTKTNWEAACGHLRRVYALTPREAVVALRVAAGMNAREVAEELGISVGTVRVHIKRILGKTGTNRQSQLVGLILRAILQEAAPQDVT